MRYGQLNAEQRQQLREAALKQIEERHYATKIARARAKSLDDEMDVERHDIELAGLEAQHGAVTALTPKRRK